MILIVGKPSVGRSDASRHDEIDYLTPPIVVSTFFSMKAKLKSNGKPERKPRRGRPPLGDLAQTARVNFRTHPRDRRRYVEAAARAGLSLAAWAKDCLNRAARRELGR